MILLPLLSRLICKCRVAAADETLDGAILTYAGIENIQRPLELPCTAEALGFGDDFRDGFGLLLLFCPLLSLIQQPQQIRVIRELHSPALQDLCRSLGLSLIEERLCVIRKLPNGKRAALLLK